MSRSQEQSRQALELPALPRNEDAERTVLGCVLVNPKAVFDVVGMLRVEHFHTDAHRRIWAAIERLARENKPIDSLTIHSAIGSADVPFVVIDALTAGIPRSTNIAYYAGLIMNAAQLREAVLSARDVILAATAPAAQASDVLEQAQAAYFRLASDPQRKTLWWADEMTMGLANDIDGETVTPPLPPIAVGLPSVDGLFDGFVGGDLAFIAGRPGTGKTSLGQQIALQAAEERTVLVCAMEMKHTAMWRRALSTVSRIPVPMHRRRMFTDNEQRQIGKGLAKLGSLRLAIENMPNASDMQVLAAARRVQMQRGLGLIIVDYLQLMRADGKFRARGEELAVLTRSLKQIAMQLDVPIVVMAALSREAVSGRPSMAHIRECGTAEYDADHIFLMHRDVDEQKNLEPGQPSRAELIVEKQRNGPTGSLPLWYMGDIYRFESVNVA